MSSDRTQWHRLAGLVVAPLFRLLGYETQLEVDVALQKQLLDIIVVRKGRTAISPPSLPPSYWEAFDDLNEHNLISFKSYSESFNAEALEELFGHLTNYRKVNDLSSEQIHLYAIVNHYPKALFTEFEGTEFLKVVKEKQIYDLELRPLKRVRFIITRETDNPLLALFSAEPRKVSESYTQLKEQTTLLANVSAYLNKLSEYYNQEMLNMYTREDFMRDYPPADYAPFVFPWEKEYHEQELKKAAEAAKEAAEAAKDAAEKAAKDVAEKAAKEAAETAKIETAQLMVSKGIETSLICEVTGLSEDVVLKLKPDA
jgi:hypothetical protein